MTRLELNILGCGSATSTLQHLPSSQVLNVRDNLLMIDCGEGAQLEMRRQKLKFSRLNHIFISHLHGDHCFGLPGLISTLALLGKTSTMTVHIFADGAKIFGDMLSYFCRQMPFELKFDVIGTQPATIYEDDAVTVSTVTLRHRIPCVGFVVREKPKLRHINPQAIEQYDIPRYALNSLRAGNDYADGLRTIPNSLLTTPAEPSMSYAYCSDTAFSPRVIEAVEGVDWLYHEATYADECAPQARQRYHSTAREAATVAREAGVKHLILGHYSKRYTDLTSLLEQAREEFPATRLANEGMCLDLNTGSLLHGSYPLNAAGNPIQ